MAGAHQGEFLGFHGKNSRDYRGKPRTLQDYCEFNQYGTQEWGVKPTINQCNNYNSQRTTVSEQPTTGRHHIRASTPSSIFSSPSPAFSAIRAFFSGRTAPSARIVGARRPPSSRPFAPSAEPHPPDRAPLAAVPNTPSTSPAPPCSSTTRSAKSFITSNTPTACHS